MAIPGGSSGPGSLQPLGSVRIWGMLAGGLQRPYHFLPLDVSPCACGHWLSHFVGQQPCYLSCPQVSPSCATSPTLGLAGAFTAPGVQLQSYPQSLPPSSEQPGLHPVPTLFVRLAFAITAWCSVAFPWM